MAISTYMTFLMHKSGDAYEKLIDIKDFPDLGSAPDMIETTTLSDKQRTYISGIIGLGDGLQFNANYSKEDYQKLDALTKKQEDYAIWFGGTESAGVVTPTGSAGKFKFTGELATWVTGGGVNEPVGLGVSIAPSTPIVLDET